MRRFLGTVTDSNGHTSTVTATGATFTSSQGSVTINSDPSITVTTPGQSTATLVSSGTTAGVGASNANGSVALGVNGTTIGFAAVDISGNTTTVTSTGLATTGNVVAGGIIGATSTTASAGLSGSGIATYNGPNGTGAKTFSVDSATGAIQTSGNATVSGKTTTGSLAVTSNASVGGTLSVGSGANETVINGATGVLYAPTLSTTGYANIGNTLTFQQGEINGLNSRMDKAYQGIAMATAFDKPFLGENQKFGISGGFGDFAGVSAGSVNAIFRFNQNWTATGGVSFSQGGQVAGKGAIGFAW